MYQVVLVDGMYVGGRQEQKEERRKESKKRNPLGVIDFSLAAGSRPFIYCKQTSQRVMR
jgi:hypothetical protein